MYSFSFFVSIFIAVATHPLLFFLSLCVCCLQPIFDSFLASWNFCFETAETYKDLKRVQKDCRGRGSAVVYISEVMHTPVVVERGKEKWSAFKERRWGESFSSFS